MSDEEVRAAALYVYNRFAEDLKKGYRTRDKVFAVEVLGKALGLETNAPPASSARLEPTGE